jgi:hypothetical protein
MAVGADEKESMKQLVPCFTQAERTRTAAYLVKSGQPKEALEAQLTSALVGAPPAEIEGYKAALNEAIAEKPGDPDAYVAQKLNQCVGGTSSKDKQHIARPCYEVTLHAHDLYVAKQQGLALEKVKAAAAESLSKAGKSPDFVATVQNMAGAIYGIDQPEAIFRARWFASCVIQSK